MIRLTAILSALRRRNACSPGTRTVVRAGSNDVSPVVLYREFYRPALYFSQFRVDALYGSLVSIFVLIPVYLSLTDTMVSSSIA